MKQSFENRLLKSLLLLIFGCISILSYSQNNATEGNEFYVSFRHNVTDPVCQIRYVVTQTCQITAQYGDGTYLDNNTVYTPGIYTKNVEKSKCYVTTSGISNKIIKVTSTENIGVFAINLAAATTDATTIIPTKALGNHYTVISHAGNSPCIHIVAPENGTIFTIKNAAGAVVLSNIALSSGQTYSYVASIDLTGYTVESNYNIAVYSTVACGNQVSSGACDTNYEQIWPTDTAGKNYFLWNMSPQFNNDYTRDQIKILALEDGTEIIKKVGSTVTTITLNKHATNTFFLDTAVYKNNSVAPVRLTANKPIIVENVLGYAPCIKWISPVEQGITSAAISPFVPTGTNSVIVRHQLHIMIPAGTEANTIVKETRSGVTQELPLTFVTNTTDPNYVLAKRQYSAEDNVLIEIANPSGFIAYMAGYGNYESYIYTAGTGAFNLQAYYTIATKTSPLKDTYYSVTTPMTHTFEEIDEVTIKRTIEKSFSAIHWLLNGVPYTGVTENTDISKEWHFPASDLTVGENTLTMSVRYTGNSADSLYKSKIWLSGISSYPDNVVDPTCVKEADPAVWGIEESLPINKTDLIHNYGPLVVGDIDGDGKIEIIGLLEDTRSSNGYESNGIKIFNYEDNEVKLKKSFNISTGGSSTASFGSMAIARYNNQGYIVLVGVDMYLYAYSPNGDRLWKSDVVCSKTAINIVNIADFNNDGIPEIYVDNNIFSLANGKLLCSGQANNTGSMTGNGSSPMAIDVDNDGKLELCAGTQIYKVNITNTNGTAGNTMTVIADMGLLTTDLPQFAATDGMTQLVDMDGDGMLEVVVTSRSNNRVVVYVWKPQPDNGSYLMGSYLVPATGVSYNSIPMIGDIDNDGYPEIVFITNGSSFLMYALDFDPSLPVGNMLKEKWTLTHTDGSGCTGMSLFDFNLDGTAEIVYRDQTTLRIIDGSGSTPIVKETFSNVLSGTLREYPVIADLDKDGQAEIVVTGSNGSAISQNAGYLRVFKSAQTQWAPARSVWNQYNYNSVNVNENLTIPAVQFPITTRFKGRDGVMGTADDIRVFNNFRQQQTYLNKDGVAFMKIPNAKVLDPNDIRFTYHSDGDSLVVNKLIVTNIGEASLKAPLKITVYKDAVSASSRKYYYEYPVSIGVGETYTINFNIPDFSDWLPVNKLIVKINDAGLGLNDQQVCDSCCVNNESDAFVNVSFDNIAWADSYRKCEDGTVIFDALTLPGGSVTYKWLKPDGTLLSNTQSTTLSHLALNNVGKYTLKADNINNNLSLAYTLPYLSVAPSLMYWRTDAQDNNWNNLNNWAKSSLLGDVLLAVPSTCTTVHIPSMSNNYPSLDAHTDRTIYGEAVADQIVFHFGGQVAYPHKLTYNKAYIQYNWGYYAGINTEQPGTNAEGNASKMITREKWYMLAAPLKKMASGDFAMGGYPITWQSIYNAPHPTSGALVEGDFSIPFSSNDIDLSTKNNALAVKVACYNTNLGYSNHRNLEGLQGILEIPYFENNATSDYHPGHVYNKIRKESRFYYFDEKTLQQLASPIGTLARGNEAYRFVFEDSQTNQASNIVVYGVNVPGYTQHVTSGASIRNTVMIGNPFMATINSRRFFEANRTKLKEDAGYYMLTPTNQVWSRYEYRTENKIPALQAIVITLAEGLTAADLVYPLEGAYALTEASSRELRSSVTPAGSSLYIRATDGSNNTSDYAILNSDESSESTAAVNKMIYPASHSAVEAFIVSSDQEYNLVDFYKGDRSEVGLGIKSSNQKDVLTLKFENVDSFKQATGFSPVLVDKYMNIEQDLSSDNVYRFNQRKTDSDKQYTDANRFLLRLSSATSGIIDETGSNNLITVIYQANQLEATSSEGLVQVDVYDLQGRHLHSSGTIQGAPLTYSKYLPLNRGVYIVKIKTSQGQIVAKKINAL